MIPCILQHASQAGIVIEQIRELVDNQDQTFFSSQVGYLLQRLGPRRIGEVSRRRSSGIGKIVKGLRE